MFQLVIEFMTAEGTRTPNIGPNLGAFENREKPEPKAPGFLFLVGEIYVSYVVKTITGKPAMTGNGKHTSQKNGNGGWFMVLF